MEKVLFDIIFVEIRNFLYLIKFLALRNRKGKFGLVKGKACETPQQDNSSSALEIALWRALPETMVLLRMSQSDASARLPLQE